MKLYGEPRHRLVQQQPQRGPPPFLQQFHLLKLLLSLHQRHQRFLLPRHRQQHPLRLLQHEHQVFLQPRIRRFPPLLRHLNLHRPLLRKLQR